MTFLRKYIWVLVILGMIFVSLVISLIFLIINKCIFTKGKHKVLHHQKRSDTDFFEHNKYQERNSDACSPVPSLPPRTQFFTEDALGSEDQADEHDYEQMPDYEQSTDQQPDYVKVEEETKLASPSSFYNYSNPQKRPSALLGENHKDLDGENSFEECTDQQLDYVRMEEETNILPPPPFYNSPNGKSGASLGESHKNLAEENDYEESVDHQPDYETADNETEIFPPPPLCNNPKTSGGSLCQSYENLAEENDYEESADQQPDYVTVEDEEAAPAADNTSEEDYDDIGSENEEDYDDVA